MASASDSIQPGWFKSTFFRWLGTRTDEQRGTLLRLLALFKPCRGKIAVANVLIIVSSFVGVFSLIAFLPILKVLFPDETKSKPKAESALVVEPWESGKSHPAEKATGEGGLSERASRFQKIPLIGPGLAKIQTKIEAVRANIKKHKEEFNQYILQNKFRGVSIIALALLLATLLGASMGYFANLLMAQVETQTFQRFSQELYDHCIRMDLSFFQRNSTGMLMTRIYNDVAMLRQLVQLLYTDTIREPVTMIFLLILLFSINAGLTLLVMVFLPLAVLPAIVLARRIREISRREVSQDGFVMDQMQTTFSGIKLVKSFGSEDHESRRFAGSNRMVFRRRYKRRMIKELTDSLSDMVTVVGMIVILMTGALMMFRLQWIRNGSEFVMYLIVLNRFYKPLKNLSGLHVSLQRALMSAERIFGILDAKPAITEPADPMPWPTQWNHVRFNDVSFKYANKPKDPWILEDLTLWIPRGKMTALIGRNGAGKSTIASLLCRFYLPLKGSITIGETPLDRIAEKDLRRRVIILSQETILFNATLRENIAYGVDTIDEERVLWAARMTHADDFIAHMPDGYDTVVGERGSRLSGGQRRLIALARVLYRDPEILILDEPEASLDVKHQALFYKVLNTVAQGRTTLLITHRPPTHLSVNKVVVIHERRTQRINREDISAESMEQIF